MKRKTQKSVELDRPKTRHESRCHAEYLARKSNPKALAHYRQFIAFSASGELVWAGPHIVRRVGLRAAVRQQRRWLHWRAETFPNETRPVVAQIVIEDASGKGHSFRV